MDPHHRCPDVLIIDHHAAFRTMLQDMLVRAGFRVRCASGGIAALASIHQEMPDLILLAATEEDFDGVHLCAALRDDTRTQDVPIVLLSAFDDYATRALASGIGAKLLTTPVDRALLCDEILRHTPLERPAIEPIVVHADGP